MSPTNVNVVCEYKLLKIDIALKQLQLYDISIDFPVSFKLVSNKKYVQLNKAHKFLVVRIFKFKY